MVRGMAFVGPMHSRPVMAMMPTHVMGAVVMPHHKTAVHRHAEPGAVHAMVTKTVTEPVVSMVTMMSVMASVMGAVVIRVLLFALFSCGRFFARLLSLRFVEGCHGFLQCGFGILDGRFRLLDIGGSFLAKRRG